MTYLDELIKLGQRKGTQVQMLSLSYGINWLISLETKIDGAELKITNTFHTDFEGAVGEVVDRFNKLAGKAFQAPQIEHQPPAFNRALDDEIPF